MAKPKLALIPAAQGTKLYSVLPSDGTGDFTFTRGSKATRINAQGLIETVASGQSRLDYPLIDGVQKGCPHHILEPQRTNSILYSQQVDNSYWLKSNCTITPNTSISPDGALNADILTISSGTIGVIYKTGIATGSLSFFAKDNNLSNGRFRVSVDGVGFALWNKDGTLYSVTGGTASAGVNYGNGWFRFSYNVTSGSVVKYGSEGSIGENILVYGILNEPSATFSTSYIPTTTTTVTRLAEAANGAGNSTTFNDSEGVLMAEISALANDGTTRQIDLSFGAANSDYVRLEFATTSNLIYGVIKNTTQQAALSYTLPSSTDLNKIAIKYKVNDFSLFVNGFEVDTDTNGTTPSNLNNLNFTSGTNANPFYGNTKQIQYFDSALDSQQLEQLTSWQSFRDMANGQLYTIE